MRGFYMKNLKKENKIDNKEELEKRKEIKKLKKELSKELKIIAENKIKGDEILKKLIK